MKFDYKKTDGSQRRDLSSACYNSRILKPAGIYIHIPFCRSHCSYCDFATGMYSAEAAERYVRTVVSEIESWAVVDPPEPVDTIYFGGGTPSLLSPDQLETLLNAVSKRFEVAPNSEVTM